MRDWFLVGLELQPGDVHILDTALLFAKDLGAHVLALHVLGGSCEEGVGVSSPFEEALRKQLDARKEEASKELNRMVQAHAAFGVPFQVEIAQGRPCEVLMERAALLRSSAPQGGEVVVTVGTGRMQGSFWERWLGSTTEHLLKHQKGPILVVPSGGGSSCGRTVDPHGGRWVVAVDGSEPSMKALGLAWRWSNAMSAQLTIVHASADRHAISTLETTVARVLSSEGRERYTLRVTEKEPAQAILEEAEKIEGALIVMGTHGRSGVERALIGSTARRVLETTRLPVLCYHASARG
ncbi:MAG: universal stress protein [Sandaracinaceae bacterium]|nr:universal stress protein [Sandaracinaceae bacterium]